MRQPNGSAYTRSQEPCPGEEFLRFYEREYTGLVALAASLIGDRSMAEDIAQDALLAAYGRWREVGALESPLGWTRRVVTNKSVSLIRRRLAELRAMSRLGTLVKIDFEHESDADFWRLVRSLPRRQAQVVALHYVSDMSVVDIARDANPLAEASKRTGLAGVRGTREVTVQPAR